MEWSFKIPGILYLVVYTAKEKRARHSVGKKGEIARDRENNQNKKNE
jgi:hypothetical protein